MEHSERKGIASECLIHKSNATDSLRLSERDSGTLGSVVCGREIDNFFLQRVAYRKKDFRNTKKSRVAK